MTAEVLLPIVAGFILIIGAMGLAFRQTMSGPLLIVFALGAVLVGVSGVQLQFNESGVTASIGELKSASMDTGAAIDALAAANKQLGQAVAALTTRMSQLQASLKQPAPPANTTLDIAAFGKHLADTKLLTDRAKLSIGRIPAK
jgi:hypothetical protein